MSALSEAEFMARISNRPAYVVYDELRCQYRATHVPQRAGSRLMERINPPRMEEEPCGSI